MVHIEDRLFHAGNDVKDITNVCEIGLGVNDNNNLPPENIPIPDEAALPNNQTWDWDGIDI